MNSNRRITFITQGPATPDRDWRLAASSTARMVFIESLPVLRYAIQHGVGDMELDVERVILDRAANADDMLHMLATLPPAFRGDILMIRDDDSGYLSAMGRGDDRVLYQLGASDVRFYLEMHGLVSSQQALRVA